MSVADEPKAKMPNGWTEEALAKRVATVVFGKSYRDVLMDYIATHETPPDPIGDKARELWEVYRRAPADGFPRDWESVDPSTRVRFCTLAAHVLGVPA